MHFTQIIGTCRMFDLKTCETFIQKKRVDDFKKGAVVEVFMILAEPAYGFRAVSLTTGYFDFDADGEVVKVI